MKAVKPIYKRLLIAAMVIWIIGMTFFIIDIYLKLGEVEHALAHAQFGQHPH